MGIVRRKALASLFACILGFTTLVHPSLAEAVDVNYHPTGDTRPSIVAMGLDFLVVRPLTFALTVVGSVFWVVSLPITALGGNVEEAGEQMVLEPGQYTFVRPLGHMHLEPVDSSKQKKSSTAMSYK